MWRTHRAALRGGPRCGQGLWRVRQRTGCLPRERGKERTREREREGECGTLVGRLPPTRDRSAHVWGHGYDAGSPNKQKKVAVLVDALLIRGSSGFESLILSHHSRCTRECNKEELQDDHDNQRHRFGRCSSSGDHGSGIAREKNLSQSTTPGHTWELQTQRFAPESVSWFK